MPSEVSGRGGHGRILSADLKGGVRRKVERRDGVELAKEVGTYNFICIFISFTKLEQVIVASSWQSGFNVLMDRLDTRPIDLLTPPGYV